MIDHIGLAVADFVAAKQFYAAALKPIGYALVMEVPAALTGSVDAAGFGGGDRADLWIAGGGPMRPPLHVALRAGTRREVDAFHAAALVAGAKDNGPPGLRPHYHEHYYAAFVIDPDGHNLEVVCHAPA